MEDQGNPHMSVHVQRYLGMPAHVKKKALGENVCKLWLITLKNMDLSYLLMLSVNSKVFSCP